MNLPPLPPLPMLALPPLPALRSPAVACKGVNCRAFDGGDIPHSPECVAEHERLCSIDGQEDPLTLPPLPPLTSADAAPIPAGTSMCHGCTPDNCSGCKVDKAGNVDPGSRAYQLPAGVTVEPVAGQPGAFSIGREYQRPAEAYEPDADETPGITPWFGMHELPNPERRGEYEVRISKRPRSNWPFPHHVIERHYWDGKRWPTLMGQFDADGWRGLIARADA